MRCRERAELSWRSLAICSLLLLVAADARPSLSLNRHLLIPAAGTPTENCAALRAALEGITDASSTNRYLLELEPGEYFCGSQTLFLKGWTTLKGAGRSATLLEGSVSTGLGLVNLTTFSELREVRVFNRYLFAGSAGADIVAVSAVSLQGSIASARLFDVDAEAASTSSDPEVALFTLNADDLQIWHSRLEASGAGGSAVKTVAGDSVEVRFSTLDGGVSGPGSVTCLYSSSPGAPLTSACAEVP